MIDRASISYQTAKDRVKVSFFTERGYDITGLVHIGANDGYEVEHYLAMGITPVICFEPLKSALIKLQQNYGINSNVEIWWTALGNIDADVRLTVTAGDGKGSSFLPERTHDADDQVAVHAVEDCQMRRFATVVERGDFQRCNCCVIDVQGMELDVLRGMDQYIRMFDFLSVECSITPIYRGEASAEEVISYLSAMGFERVSPIPAHDDVFFINRNVLHPPPPPKPMPTGTKLNCGSGQRPFLQSEGWINIDIQDKYSPDLVCDWNDLGQFHRGTIDLVVAHHTIEHVGCGEAETFIREAHRVLKPGGSLLICVPNMQALAQRWLMHQLDDYQYFVNTYGAYMGDEADRHRWGYTWKSLQALIDASAEWSHIKGFDWREIPGANIARDWWILAMEGVK